MELLEPKELIKREEFKKKPLWKNRNFWILGVFIILLISYFNGAFKSVSENVEETYYEYSVFAFHEINQAFDENREIDKEVVDILYEDAKSMDVYPDEYTDKEIYIHDQLVKMLLSVGMISQYGEENGLGDDFYEARSNAADVLEIDNDY